MLPLQTAPLQVQRKGDGGVFVSLVDRSFCNS